MATEYRFIGAGFEVATGVPLIRFEVGKRGRLSELLLTRKQAYDVAREMLRVLYVYPESGA